MRRWMKAVAGMLAAAFVWSAAGNISATAGNMTATAGNISATAGNFTATAGSLPADGAERKAGDAAGQTFDYDSLTDPAVPHAKVQAKKLYVLSPGGYEDMVTAGTLQGLMANKSEENLYIVNSQGSKQWLEQLKNVYGVETENAGNIWDVVSILAPKVSGYILCSSAADESVNVATSLCSQFDAIAVSEGNEERAKQLGLQKLLDVRGWDEEELRDHKEYYDKLNKDVAVELRQNNGANLRDYAVMSNAMMFFSPHKEGNRELFLGDLNDNFALFGWGDGDLGEGGFVSQTSDYNGYTVPSDYAYNLAVLSGYRIEQLEQKTAKPTGEVKDKHTICFMMTDGDNVQWNLNSFPFAESWYGSSARGQVSMGWGAPATLIDLAPAALEWMYDQATPRDGFITQLSGLGYMYPSLMSRENLEKHVTMLNDYMGRSGTNIIEVMDKGSFEDPDLWDIYMKQPNIDGAFYIDFSNYSKMQGAMRWVNGKPLIGSRFNLWTGESGGLDPGGNVDDLIRLFGDVDHWEDPLARPLTTDPTLQSGYSLVMVHCWSHTTADVKRIADSLDPEKFDVVTPQEFLARIVKNKPQYDIQPGWHQISGKWYLFDEKGQPLIGLQTYEGKTYYLDIFGERQSGWITLDHEKYYFDANGVMQTGWQRIGGRQYYFDTDGKVRTGFYQVGSNRYYADRAGAIQTGWQKIGGRWYFFGTDGVMRTGWYQDGKKWYLSNSAGVMQTGWQKVGGKWYYLGTDGGMRTGWFAVGKKWYLSNGSGAMQTGWQKVGGKWYYLGTDGGMRTGWFTVGRKWYYANSSGAMQTGWQKVGGKWYYLGADGGMRTGWYKVGSKWYYSNGSGAMQTGWVKSGGKWYWFDGSGRMIAATSRKIGRRTYRFNGSGVCLNP